MNLSSLVKIYTEMNKVKDTPVVKEPEYMYIERKETEQKKCCGIKTDGNVCQNYASYHGFCFTHRNQKVVCFNC